MPIDTLPSFRVVFAKTTHGYWDGGAKSGGDFTPSIHHPDDPERSYVRYDCWSLNHWFTLPLHYMDRAKKNQEIPKKLLIRQIRRQLRLRRGVNGYIMEI